MPAEFRTSTPALLCLIALSGGCGSQTERVNSPSGGFRGASVGDGSRARVDAAAVPVTPDPGETNVPTLWIATSSGWNEIDVFSIDIDEQLGRIPSARVEGRVHEFIAPDDYLGKRATVGYRGSPGSMRYFNGYISSVVSGPCRLPMPEELEPDEGPQLDCVVDIVVEPWLWLLTRTAGCEVFQDLTAPELAERVFGRQEFADFRMSLVERYPVLPLALQYRETDFNLIARTLEQDGIFYLFEHHANGHTMVLYDSNDALPLLEMGEPFQRGESNSETTANEWVHQVKVQPTRYTLHDRNYLTPDVPLVASADASTGQELSGFEVFDSPGDYNSAEAAQWYAKRRVEEVQAESSIISFTTRNALLRAGHRFEVRGDDTAPERYVAIRTTLRVSIVTYDSGDARISVLNLVSAIPEHIPFRPSRITPKPAVQGIQTAVVVGPRHADPNGRAQIVFNWSRAARDDESSWVWVRVGQPMIDVAESGVRVPEVGEEVVVMFEEGDPNRPLIMGTLRNGASPAAWPLGSTRLVVPGR